VAYMFLNAQVRPYRYKCCALSSSHLTHGMCISVGGRLTYMPLHYLSVRLHVRLCCRPWKNSARGPWDSTCTKGCSASSPLLAMPVTHWVREKGFRGLQAPFLHVSPLLLYM
jgi:hypothetical protein